MTRHKKSKEWEDCICHHKNHHTLECKSNHKKNLRKTKYDPKWIKRRHELRKQHRCIWCKKKVKPKITYPQFCKEHNATYRKYQKEYREENKKSLKIKREKKKRKEQKSSH